MGGGAGGEKTAKSRKGQCSCVRVCVLLMPQVCQRSTEGWGLDPGRGGFALFRRPRPQAWSRRHAGVTKAASRQKRETTGLKCRHAMCRCGCVCLCAFVVRCDV